jgi:hypothetical protein
MLVKRLENIKNEKTNSEKDWKTKEREMFIK